MEARWYRPDIEGLVAQARRLAQSQTALELLRLVDELMAFGRLGAEMREAQQEYYRLVAAQAPQQLRDQAFRRARALEDQYDARVRRLGLGRQQGLPGV